MCNHCGSEEIIHLGSLGNIKHGRCRACGINLVEIDREPDVIDLEKVENLAEGDTENWR